MMVSGSKDETVRGLGCEDVASVGAGRGGEPWEDGGVLGEPGFGADGLWVARRP